MMAFGLPRDTVSKGQPVNGRGKTARVVLRTAAGFWNWLTLPLA
jgi:hypothetical protein